MDDLESRIKAKGFRKADDLPNAKTDFIIGFVSGLLGSPGVTIGVVIEMFRRQDKPILWWWFVAGAVISNIALIAAIILIFS